MQLQDQYDKDVGDGAGGEINPLGVCKSSINIRVRNVRLLKTQFWRYLGQIVIFLINYIRRSGETAGFPEKQAEHGVVRKHTHDIWPGKRLCQKKNSKHENERKTRKGILLNGVVDDESQYVYSGRVAREHVVQKGAKGLRGALVPNLMAITKEAEKA